MRAYPIYAGPRVWVMGAAVGAVGAAAAWEVAAC